MGKKLDKSIYFDKVKYIHHEKYGYSKSVYINLRDSIIITCPIHGDFKQNARTHLRGSGCPMCANDKRKSKNYVEKCVEKFGDKFDYSNSIYKTSREYIEVKCNGCGGEFTSLPLNHLKTGKCPNCSNTTKSLLDFISIVEEKYPKQFIFEKTKYVNNKTPLIITCKKHGDFTKRPDKVIQSGCPICSSINHGKWFKRPPQDFIKQVEIIHNGKYDYSLTDYKKSIDSINIICPTHGLFSQRASTHLEGKGCPKCGNSLSKSENEINEYLKSISITAETSNRTVLNGLELDIYIPSHNIAIEFDGLYWHSEIHKDKKYHLNKTELCEKKGIQLIHIFEDEWIFKKNIVKSRLKNILGLTSNKIFGRKTVVKEVETKQARLFFENNHLQGYTNSKIKVGLYYKDELVSCMLFSKPRIGIGSSYDGYELTRFANLVNTNVIGGASKLLKYFEKVYQPVEIRSYADRRWSDGGLYDVLGFELSHINKPNYWYIEGNQRKHRFGYRKNILKKLGFDIKDKTEHEICFDNGMYRIYDCGTLSYKKIIW